MYIYSFSVRRCRAGNSRQILIKTINARLKHMKKRYLAIDIGASSGRHIVGWEESGAIRTEEVYRFPNGVTRADGHLTWDIPALLGHVTAGIEKTRSAYPDIVSLSIDTWGVDYVLMRGGEEVWPCYAYRDDRTKEAIPRAHALVPFSELYRRTGIQIGRAHV